MDFDYDLAVVGGGIHGVGVAQAAVAAGYSVVLLEQYSSLAQGTSSRSSKLIHGGLRYLENFEFSLVRECLTERSYLLKNAPELVELKPVYIPIYTHSKRSPSLIRAGLSLYALLGGLRKASRFRKIYDFDDDALQGLNKTDLRAVFCYYEAQTDDAKLTKSVMQSAQSLGAKLMLNAAVSQIELQQHGALVKTQSSNSSQEMSVRCVVNAAGPWATQVLDNVIPKQTNIAVDLVQGTHIILPINWNESIFYVESPKDGRPVFIMPWYGELMIGTTELLFEKDPAETNATEAEINYLLETFYAYFPEMRDKKLSVKNSFAGLRVLPRSEENPNQRSRETIFLRDRDQQPRIVSIFGGKLTAYRATAELTLNKIKSSLPDKQTVADTKRLSLPS